MENVAQNPAPAAAIRPDGEAIIRAEKIEKYYAQPSQNRIQVISPTDLTHCSRGDCRPAWPFRIRQIDHAAHAFRPFQAHRRPGVLARPTDRRGRNQRFDRVPELCPVSVANRA